MEITRFWLLYFPRLEAFDASSAHLRKPQLAWLFLYWGADLNLSAFPIGRNGKTRAFLKEKADTFPTNHVRSSEVIENDGRPVGTRTPDHYRAKVARIGIVITYKTAGTAKVRGSHTFCGLGCGLKITTGSSYHLRFFAALRARL